MSTETPSSSWTSMETRLAVEDTGQLVVALERPEEEVMGLQVEDTAEVPPVGLTGQVAKDTGQELEPWEQAQVEGTTANSNSMRKVVVGGAWEECFTALDPDLALARYVTPNI